ncbi:MAG TPA: hypothetical protein VEX63_04095, partial [Flavisolibacter sp.]|nr:hypothetical protein [Flavisolibacter sp.]
MLYKLQRYVSVYIQLRRENIAINKIEIQRFFYWYNAIIIIQTINTFLFYLTGNEFLVQKTYL